MSDEREAADQHAEVVRAEMLRLSEVQMERADRIRGSARQTFIYVSGLFTVAQAMAFSSFAADEVSTIQQRWVISIAVSAAVAVAVVGVFALLVERTKTVPDISPDDVIGEADKATDESPIEDRLVRLHYKAANKRMEAVGTKRTLLKYSNAAAIVAVVLVLGEVVYSLIARWP